MLLKLSTYEHKICDIYDYAILSKRLFTNIFIILVVGCC